MARACIAEQPHSARGRRHTRRMSVLGPQGAHVLANPGAFAWRVLKGFKANQGLLLAGAVACTPCFPSFRC